MPCVFPHVKVFDKLAKRTTYTEKDARELSLVLLETMHAMHSRSLVHRDLKPENLLLKNKFDDSNIKVAGELEVPRIDQECFLNHTLI
jgi:serine/threonine protein kinase